MRQWIVHRHDREDGQILEAAVEALPALIREILEYLPPEQT
jgi:hypothetical protein